MKKKLIIYLLTAVMAFSPAAVFAGAIEDEGSSDPQPAEAVAAEEGQEAAAEEAEPAAETPDENAEEAAAEEAPGFTGSYLMGTGSATGNYYAFGNAVCTVVNNVTGANLTVNATGGSTEYARLLGSKENELP